MKKYYTRACNFYYGDHSKRLVKKKKALPLNSNIEISFDHIEILSRNNSKLISIKEIKNLPLQLKKKVNKDLRIIAKRKKNFSNLNFKNLPNIMGVLNLTPDSFSDGGQFNTTLKAIKHAKHLLNSGADLIDVGGESTRPGSKAIKENLEWKRISKFLELKSKKIPISLDTRKSNVMKKGIELGVRLINDVSGLNYDEKTINILKKYKTPFVIQHRKEFQKICKKTQFIKMNY